MTYQFKYMEIPEQKRSGGGAFKGIKIFLEIAVTIVALGTIYNYHQDKPAPAATQAPAVIQQQASLTGAIYQQTGIAPTAEVLQQAQDMAQQFVTTGDLSDFDKHANSGDLGFDF